MNTDDLIRTLATEKETAKGRWPVSLRLIGVRLVLPRGCRRLGCCPDGVSEPISRMPR